MPIETELIRENRAVLQTYSEPLTAQVMNKLRTQMEDVILPSASGKLHIIADFSAVQNVPGTILSSGSAMLRRPHTNTGQIICVTSSGFVNAMARMLISLSPKQSFIVVRSLEEAYKAVDKLLGDVT
jgi:hypothetical protein